MGLVSAAILTVLGGPGTLTGLGVLAPSRLEGPSHPNGVKEHRHSHGSRGPANLMRSGVQPPSQGWEALAPSRVGVCSHAHGSAAQTISRVGGHRHPHSMGSTTIHTGRGAQAHARGRGRGLLTGDQKAGPCSGLEGSVGEAEAPELLRGERGPWGRGRRSRRDLGAPDRIQLGGGSALSGSAWVPEEGRGVSRAVSGGREKGPQGFSETRTSGAIWEDQTGS